MLTLEEAMPTIKGQVVRFCGRFRVVSLEKKDLVQEGVLVYLTKCAQRHDESRAAFRTFLARCCWNHFVDLYRAERRRPCVSIHQDQYGEQAFEIPSPTIPSYSLTFSPELSRDADRLLRYMLNGGESCRSAAKDLGIHRVALVKLRREILDRAVLAERN